jgi:hypothetical protein
MQSGSIKWDPWTQWFDEFSLWDGGWEGGVAQMFVKMGENKVEIGKGAKEFKMNRGPKGDGMLLGIFGFSGSNVDQLQPLFSKGRSTGAIVKDMTFSPTFEELSAKGQLG